MGKRPKLGQNQHMPKGAAGLGTGLVFGICSQAQGHLGVWLRPLVLPLYFQGRGAWLVSLHLERDWAPEGVSQAQK